MLKLVIKRFLLIIIGIILSLIFLECGLRFAGWTISSYQQYKNNKALRNKSQYTIMCLGESTTQGQYPVQLQKILDKKYPNKFSVIDCGLTSTHLKNILYNIDININKYKPDITICMMGINDIIMHNSNKISYIKKDNILSKLKIYNFFILLKKHICSSLKKTSVYADNVRDINYINELFLSNDYKKTIQLSEELLKENPNNEEIYFYYINSLNQYSDKCYYIDHTIREEEFIKYKMKIVELSKALINNDCKFKFTLKDCYKIIFVHGKENEKIFYINKLIEKNSDIIDLNLYFLIKKYIGKEQKEKILSFLKNNQNDTTYGFLAINALEQKRYKKCQELFNKAEKLRLKSPDIETYKLYKLIIKKLIDNNIKVICMQYPVRSIKPLQEQLKNEPYYDKITFISNEKVFKEAIKEKNYNKIFNDQFAGDFGHCTNLGNTLIAKNVVNTLKNILDLKQN